MKQAIFEVLSNETLLPGLHRLRLRGDCSAVQRPGQFVNVQLDGLFLRRPFSVCGVQGDTLTVVVRRVGRGTERICALRPSDTLDLLTGLGNGFDLSCAGERPLLLGGGSGVPALYWSCKTLRDAGSRPIAALAFRTAAESFYLDEFQKLGAQLLVLTEDGSLGARGLAPDALNMVDFTYLYACGPLPMLAELDRRCKTDAQFSLEARMGCGFGACMGCTVETAQGPKRVCRDGPVFHRGEVVW